MRRLLQLLIFHSPSHTISDRKFCSREKFSKFSIRITPKNARNLARRGNMMIIRHIADVFAVQRDRASSNKADFGAIARLFDQKFCGREIFFENFGPNRAEKRAQSRTPGQYDACQTHCRRVCIVKTIKIVKQGGFWRDRKIFRTKDFAAAKDFFF